MILDEIKIKQDIKHSIHAFADGDIVQNTRKMLNVLGYDSTRSIDLGIDYFVKSDKFNSEKARTDNWLNANMIFQITSEELTGQNSLFRPDFEKDLFQSFLFYAIELKPDHYTRSDLARITREINKPLPMPVIVLFKNDNSLTLAVIERRRHKRDTSKDVLEKVTLIRNIDIHEPHRAHTEILFDLSLPYLIKKYKIFNFDGLHKAWRETLDIKELNKQFYQKLFNWYLWALQYAKFPQMRPESDMIKDHTHQSESLIRLLTRLLFVWFMKEKGLISSDLFSVRSLKIILKNFTGENSDNTIYYKAILQNLFFATLNKPVSDRKIIKKGFNPAEYGDPLVYRFDELFQEPGKMLSWFENIPFLNGGLFECLDQKKDKDNPTEIRLDGFSTKRSKQVIMPDKLFFGEYKNIDLSRDYDDKKKNKVTVYGLITILDQYKFTIEENTPVEEEIALDPELLGKVFENLLASYNPETKTTARKQTGSFYTPREIVNYMVDESLKTYLKQQLTGQNIMTSEDADTGLDILFSYTEREHAFTERETEVLIQAIDVCKILDPACGSGAFPMGILHKMIHILDKLDPENKLWFEKVIKNFPAYMQTEVRKRLENENWNYVRKLGIIQQCIYGVDIQPIATQIAKLRFFISLLVDQTVKPGEPNRGLEPLPNLDFKIVTANTLIPAPEPNVVNTGLFADIRDTFFIKFDQLTGHYFNTSKPEDKKDLRRKIIKLISDKCAQKIQEISNKFKGYDQEKDINFIKNRYKNVMAEKEWEIKLWHSYLNIFKHEAVAFFEPRYFFPNLDNGFNIVIGNPPYVKEYTYRKAFDGLRNSNYYKGKMDIWYMFACIGIDILKSNGILTFIAQNNWVTSYGASIMRKKVINETQILNLIDFGDYKIFEISGIQTMIMIFKKEKDVDNYDLDYRKLSYSKDVGFSDILDILLKKYNKHVEYINPKIIRKEYIDKPITFGNAKVVSILNKILGKGNFKLNGKTEIAQGIVFPQDFLNRKNQRMLGDKYKVGQGIFVLNDDKKDSIPFTKKEIKIIKPEYTTEELFKYYAKPQNKHWVIYTDSSFKDLVKIKQYPNIKKHLDQFKKVITSDNRPYGLHRARDERFFKGEKIVSVRKCTEPTFTYTDFDSYVSATFYVIKSERINLKYLTALLNSKLIAFWLKYKGKMQGNNYQIDKEPIIDIPILKADQSTQNVTANLVTKIIDTLRSDGGNAKQAKVREYEKQIDQLIYKLYGLTPEEIKIVESSF